MRCRDTRLLLPRRRNRVDEAALARFAPARDRARAALRRLRRTDRLAQFHHRLIPIACSFRSEERLRRGFEVLPALRRAQVAANGVEACQDARYVAIEHRVRRIERDAEHGCCGVAADSRQSDRRGEIVRKLAAVLAPRFLARLFADFSRGCNSRARPRGAALPARARARATQRWETAPGTSRSRELLPRCASAAASPRRAKLGRERDRAARDARAGWRGTIASSRSRNVRRDFGVSGIRVARHCRTVSVPPASLPASGERFCGDRGDRRRSTMPLSWRVRARRAVLAYICARKMPAGTPALPKPAASKSNRRR